jgi:histidinol-phosphatase
MPHSEFLATALDAAHAAADVVRHYYQRNIAVTLKADKSPVTEADVETERTIRAILAARFPTHGFHGEETGTSALDAEYVGSSIRSTAQRRSCANIRCSRRRSRWRTAAG